MKYLRLCYLFIIFFSTGAFAAQETLTTVVKSVQPAGNYIYIQTDGKDQEEWLATTALPVKAGDRIQYRGGLLMKDFSSTILKRSFERILFVSQLRVVGGASTMPGASLGPTPVAKSKQIEVAPGEIKKLENGKTVAEILQQTDELNGKSVRVRAKVIKFSVQVMGKNWVTLRDGTGSAPHNSVIATTQQDAKPGDVLVVEGTARTNVDLGAGYNYPILLEKAKLSPGL